MAKFKQVPQAFLFSQLLRFFRNMVANYRDEADELYRGVGVSFMGMMLGGGNAPIYIKASV